MAFWKRQQQLGLAALIMGGSILLSRFMGLIRDKVISFLFGASQQSDLYFSAFVIPDFINYLLAGAYFSITLIPLLAECFERDEADGWHFFSTVVTWIGSLITAFTLLAMLFAPQLARIAAPGLAPEATERLAFFLRIVLPAQICFLVGSCFTAILYLRKQFLVPALSPLIYNLLIILGGVLLRHRGIEGFCWGVLAGALIGNLLLPCLAVWQAGGMRLRFSVAHPTLRRFIVLALPLMLGQSIVVLDEQFVRIFGSLAGTGAISWLNYARRIMLVPVGVIAQAASVASYPFLAELVARKDSARFQKTLNEALQGVLTLLIPLSLWMMVVAEPTITLIFEQGHFGAADSFKTAQLLRLMLLAVPFWGIQQVLGRGFYAQKDTLSPAVLGTLATLLSLPLYYLFTNQLAAGGVAGASILSITLYSFLLAFWWQHRLGDATFSGLLRHVGLVLGMSLAASLPALAVGHFLAPAPSGHPCLVALWQIAVSGLSFGAALLALARCFAPELVRPYLRYAGPLGRLLERP